MKNTLLVLTLFFFTAPVLLAQRYAGNSESIYAGYLGLYVNPANVVNQRMQSDVNFLSYNISLSNDYFRFSFARLATGGGDFFDSFTTGSQGGTANIVFDTEAILAGGMFSINDKMGVGFQIKTRGILSATGFDKDLIEMAASGFTKSEFYGRKYSGVTSTLSAMSFNEYSVTFGSEVMNAGPHRLKVGGALKLYQSQGSFHLQFKDLEYEFYNEDTLKNVSGQINYSSNFNEIPPDLTKMLPWNQFAGGRFGVGGDIGVVYEYSPAKLENAPYKFKVGVSFHDIGFISIDRDPGTSNIIDFSAQTVDLNFFDGITSLNDINDKINRDSIQFSTREGSFEYLMQAPTRMNLFVDAHIWKGFYASFFSEIALHDYLNAQKTVSMNSFEIIPRYEVKKWFSVAMPISYVQYNGVAVGLALRLGPVYFGTSDLFRTFAIGSDFMGFSVYGGLRVPLYKKEV
jgi:hypothetical protein